MPGVKIPSSLRRIKQFMWCLMHLLIWRLTSWTVLVITLVIKVFCMASEGRVPVILDSLLYAGTSVRRWVAPTIIVSSLISSHCFHPTSYLRPSLLIVAQCFWSTFGIVGNSESSRKSMVLFVHCSALAQEFRQAFTWQRVWLSPQTPPQCPGYHYLKDVGTECAGV